MPTRSAPGRIASLHRDRAAAQAGFTGTRGERAACTSTITSAHRAIAKAPEPGPLMHRARDLNSLIGWLGRRHCPIEDVELAARPEAQGAVPARAVAVATRSAAIACANQACRGHGRHGSRLCEQKCIAAVRSLGSRDRRRPGRPPPVLVASVLQHHKPAVARSAVASACSRQSQRRLETRSSAGA
jgi:hypothetical protein